MSILYPWNDLLYAPTSRKGCAVCGDEICFEKTMTPFVTERWHGEICSTCTGSCIRQRQKYSEKYYRYTYWVATRQLHQLPPEIGYMIAQYLPKLYLEPIPLYWEYMWTPYGGWIRDIDLARCKPYFCTNQPREKNYNCINVQLMRKRMKNKKRK